MYAKLPTIIQWLTARAWLKAAAQWIKGQMTPLKTSSAFFARQRLFKDLFNDDWSSKDEFQMIWVSSSNVKAIWHVESKQLLRVDFLWGWTYYYRWVTKHIFERMLSATSKWKYLHWYIKKNYPFYKG